MNQPREPIFNVPAVVVGLIAALVFIHVVRAWVLTPDEDFDLLLHFAFIPARYDAATAVETWLPTSLDVQAWTFLSYALIHADITHLVVNLIWLLPFGTAVARRFGATRFLLLFVVTAVAGGAAHLITHPHAVSPMIGASAAISGFMAAAIRFVFQHGGPLENWRHANPQSYMVPAAPLLVALRDPRILAFLVVWFGLNALFGIGGVALMGGEQQEVAWQAHVGGFLAGLILFPIFDAVPTASAPGPGDADPTVQ